MAKIEDADVRNVLKQFGKNVQTIRTKKNITVKQLAEKTGISEKYLLKIEKGEAIGVSTMHLLNIAEGLAVNVCDLVISL